MEILIVSSKYMPEYAGSALRAHRTYVRLREKYGIRMRALASSAATDSKHDYTLDGLGITVIPVPKPRSGPITINGRLKSQLDHWKVLFQTWSYLVNNSFDVMHVFGKSAVTSAAVSFAKATRKPLMVELVNATDNPNQAESCLLSSLLGVGYRKDTQIVCLSEGLKKACLNHNYEPHQLWVRANPIEASKFYYEKGRQRKYRQRVSQFGFSDKILCYVAKFIPRKKQDFAVQVLRYLPTEYKLMLAGPLETRGPFAGRDREYFNSIKSSIHEHKLEKRVTLIPEFIQNPEEYIKASDVFLMPAVGEAFGTPFAESIACGVPVIANSLHDVYDGWINEGKNGYMCNLDAAIWANKIIAASNISEAQMELASTEILERASADVIDRAYYERLLALSRHTETGS